MQLLREIISSVTHLLYPSVCPGCSADGMPRGMLVCSRCLSELPLTRFEKIANNPVEKRFWGRLDLLHATAAFFFTQGSIMQGLMHELKYKGNRDLGLFLGRLMGELLKNSQVTTPEMLIPLPLHPARERSRGYNQATLLCQGMSEVLHVPTISNAVVRTSQTASQTSKGRIERWQNMEGRFDVVSANQLEGKTVCLVDDVITTGATLEACGSQLTKLPGLKLSIACLCFASRS